MFIASNFLMYTAPSGAACKRLGQEHRAPLERPGISGKAINMVLLRSTSQGQV